MQRNSDFSPEERAFVDAVELGSPTGPAACPLPAELKALEAGVLSDSARVSIEEHVRHCGICQTMLKDLPEIGQVNPTRDEESRIRARVFAEAEPKLVRPRTNWSWRLAPAFALASVVVIGVNLLYLGRPSRQEPPANTNIRASAKPPAPDVFQLDRPAAEMPPILIWRGAKPDQGLEAGLRGALDLYRSGNDAVARSRLEGLAAKYPRSAESYFYLGICQLFLGQDAGAITSLLRARQLATGSLAGEASWYLSVALVRQGDRSRAEEILQELCRSSGSYQKRACAGFEELSRR